MHMNIEVVEKYIKSYHKHNGRIISRTIHAVAKDRVPSFLRRVVFHCVNVPQLFHPRVYCWALGLFPDLGYCKFSCYEHGVHVVFQL